MPIAPIKIEKTDVWLTYQAAPAWMVGEDGATRKLEAPDRAALVGDDHYTGDYTGRIQGVESVEPEYPNGFWHSVNMALTPEQLKGVRSRTLKVEGGRLVPVADVDKWGERLWSELEGTPTLADLERDPGQEASPEAAAIVRCSVEMAALKMRLLKEAIPKNIAHSGTGLYAAKTSPANQAGALLNVGGQYVDWIGASLGNNDAYKGGYITNTNRVESRAIVSHTDLSAILEGDISTWQPFDNITCYDSWNSIQKSLDQLWTDQGAAIFTLSQYVRIFAGTYVETAWPNTTLNPDEIKGFQFIIEGDPDDSRDNIIVAPNGTDYAFKVNGGFSELRHVTCGGTPTAGCVIVSGGLSGGVRDCVMSAAKPGVIAARQSFVIDCDITVSANVRAIQVGGRYYSEVIRCKLTGPGKGSSTKAAISINNLTPECRIEACSITGFRDIVNADTIAMKAFIDMRHSAIKNCTNGLRFYASGYMRSINNIFDGVDYPYFIDSTATWPEETASRKGPELFLHNNYYNGHTAVGYDGTTGKTHAEFTAYDLVDESGDVEADPLLTSPFDGTLQAGSPCINAGIGSGVVYDVNGVAAVNPYHPAIGCDFSQDSPEEDSGAPDLSLKVTRS